MSSTRCTGLFDEPSSWRAEIIEASGLVGDERRAAASTGAALPQLLRPLERRTSTAPPGSVLDVGGGLGPVASWVRERTGRSVALVDASPTSCAIAGRLFAVPAICADVTSLPCPDGSAAVTIANGVLSLVDELRPAVAELVRVTAPGGLIVVADVTSRSASGLADGPNMFWSAEQLAAALSLRCLEVLEMACATAGAGDWARGQRCMIEAMRARCRGRRGFDEWDADQRRLEDLVVGGRIVGATIVARRPGR